jgi:hypothetical protein
MILEEALRLAALGWHIFPVGKDKTPRTPHGYKDATTNPDTIHEWEAQGLLENIAVACEASGLVVIDIDPRNGGDRTFEALCKHHANGQYPDTVSATTAGGGTHYYFTANPSERFRGRLGMGVDIKHRGYTVLPPSKMEYGNYAWTKHPSSTLLPEPPPTWLYDLAVRPQPKPYTPALSTGDERPGDIYNERTPWTEILPSLGWQIESTQGEETFWTRPGKDEGVSASTNYEGRDLLHVFTSSTELDPDTSYTKFNILAITQFGGDHSAAAKHLASEQRTGLFSAPYGFGEATEHEPTMGVPKYSFEPAFGPEHIVSRYIDYVGKQTDAPSEYAEAAALGILSTVTQFNTINLSAFPGGLKTNLYTLLVGPSTRSRKSTVQRITNNILNKVVPGAALPSKMTTEALINELSSRNGMPAVWNPDEFGILLSQVMRRDFLKGIEEMLLSVYGGDNYTYLKADGSRVSISHPHLSMVAAATAESLAFSGTQATMSGLIPRFAMVYPEALPEMRAVSEVGELDEVGIVSSFIDIRNWGHLPPHSVSFTREALDILNVAEVSIAQRGLYSARLPAMLYKVSALSALGSKRKSVTASDATSAVVVVSRWAEGASRLSTILLKKPTDYEFQRNAEEAYGQLLELGGTAHRSAIAERLKLSKARMDQLQSALMDWNYVVVDVGNVWHDKKSLVKEIG